MPSRTSENANDGVLRRDCNVDAGQETRAAAERMALNPSDDGRRAGVDRLEHGVEAHCVLDVVVVVEVDRGTLPVHVGSGAKARPLPLEPDHARISDVGESPRQFRDQSRVERIPALGARKRNAEGVPLPLDPERAHRRQLRVHWCSKVRLQLP